MLTKQTTIRNPVSCYGIGVHLGKPAHLTLRPALENTGVIFERTDISSNNFIEAKYSNVSSTSLCTTIKNDSGVEVATIEHLLAAIYGCGIDNLIVEIDSSEVPIMDGSSKAFVFMIECAGKKIQAAPKKYIKILKDIKVVHKDSEIFISPSSSLEIDLTIDFSSKIIGKQNISYNGEGFNNAIASARTFGFIRELEYLRSQGLAQGASLDNAIGIDENDVVLNSNGLRYTDEFVRHKLLDMLGDLQTASANIIGSIKGYKTSHTINNELLRTLFSDSSSYEWMTF